VRRWQRYVQVVPLQRGKSQAVCISEARLAELCLPSVGLWWACDCWDWKWQTATVWGWWTEDWIQYYQQWQCEGKVRKIALSLELSHHKTDVYQYSFVPVLLSVGTFNLVVTFITVFIFCKYECCWLSIYIQHKPPYLACIHDLWSYATCWTSKTDVQQCCQMTEMNFQCREYDAVLWHNLANNCWNGRLLCFLLRLANWVQLKIEFNVTHVVSLR